MTKSLIRPLKWLPTSTLTLPRLALRLLTVANPPSSTQPQTPSPPQTPSLQIPNAPPLLVSRCTPLVVLDLIRNLKSSPLDSLNVHSCFLKDGAMSLCAPISYPINLSLDTATFPDLLKKARLVPIYKKGSRNDPANYRPISVLPTLSKLFEKFVDNLLREHMDAPSLDSKPVWFPETL
eukprot:Pompholyxophrys_punicea_v1_NODE_23_length_5341_cov_25.501513.p1 type:complete len:179 gc:universal NODE_23_length_5341_cov_25.501513:3855-4391(+)